MNAEIIQFDQLIETVQDDEMMVLDEEIGDSNDFDLDAFFEADDANVAKKITEESGKDDLMEELILPTLPELLVTLRDDANESIATLTTNITAESFAAGAALTTTVFSALGSLVGSCGVLCVHSLGAMGQATSGLSNASGLSTGLSVPGFNVDSNGNFHLDGNIDTLSRSTGISKNDLLSGKFTAEDILSSFFSAFGSGLNAFLGVGLVGMLIGCMFDSFIPAEG